MDYVCRRITEEDKQFFLKSNVWSPFGEIVFPYYIVESVSYDVLLLPLGGQGIMKENGEEWSEMPEYSAVIWKGKSYTVEFYYVEKWYKKNDGEKGFYAKYKIKSVYAKEIDNIEQSKLLELTKKCFIAYSEGRAKRSSNGNIEFLDTEVRWL